MSPATRRFLVRIALAMFLLLGPLPVPAARAACNAHAQGGTWNSNCPVGYGFDTAANYITGVQRILKGLGYYGGSIDGLWGPLSQGATQNYQAARGLGADGIVGTNTWKKLRVELTLCGVIGGYFYEKAPGESCNGSFRDFDNGTNFPWYIKKLNGSWHTAFSTSGPT